MKMRIINLLIFTLTLTLLGACEARQQTKQQDVVDADYLADTGDAWQTGAYSTATPGTAVRYERAFENAPPMIPHTIEGFFPITLKNNMCLSCHMPDKAAAVKAIPLPETHFLVLRPEMQKKDGKYTHTLADNEIYSASSEGMLNTGYYVCSLCHAPQAEITVDIANLFKPEFRSQDGNLKSNLKNKLHEGHR